MKVYVHVELCVCVVEAVPSLLSPQEWDGSIQWMHVKTKAEGTTITWWFMCGITAPWGGSRSQSCSKGGKVLPSPTAPFTRFFWQLMTPQKVGDCWDFPLADHHHRCRCLFSFAGLHIPAAGGGTVRLVGIKTFKGFFQAQSQLTPPQQAVNGEQINAFQGEREILFTEILVI